MTQSDRLAQRLCPQLTALDWAEVLQCGRYSEGHRLQEGVTHCFRGPMHLRSRVLDDTKPGHVPLVSVQKHPSLALGDTMQAPDTLSYGPSPQEEPV